MKIHSCSSYQKGFLDGIPIGLGYLSVSFTFGMMAVNMGIPVWGAVLISMTNLTSAGQFAGLSLIVSGAPLIEMALTQLTINLRYALMSLSLSQKLHPSVGLIQRLGIAFGNTDEIFALAMQQPEEITTRYWFGLMTVPFFGWVGGTFLGGAASTILPDALRSALGIAIYGMFLAVILPPAREHRSIRAAVLIAAIISCLCYYLPVLNRLSSGFVIILCALVASTVMAILAPIQAEGTAEQEVQR